MAEEKNKLPSLDPNLDPRNTELPEIPEDIIDYKRKEVKKRKIISIAIIVVPIIIVIILISIITSGKNKEIHYVKLVSEYTATNKEAEAGADISSVELKIQNISEFTKKISKTSLDKKEAEKIFKTAEDENNDYVSLGDKGDYIVINFKTDLRDENITQLNIYEKSENNIKEAYDVFMGTSKTGPWQYLGRQAGTANINIKKYLE